MPTIEEKVALAREERDLADQRFREALRAARAAGMSWSQLATASGLSQHGVRYLTENLNEKRQAARQAAAVATK